LRAEERDARDSAVRRPMNNRNAEKEREIRRERQTRENVNVDPKGYACRR